VVNKEFVFDLNALILKEGGGTIYKRVRVFNLTIIELLVLLEDRVLY
jgi:hypothetical protein